MRMEFLDDFFKFCREQDFGNKSLAQLAVLWMLVIFVPKVGLERSLKEL